MRNHGGAAVFASDGLHRGADLVVRRAAAVATHLARAFFGDAHDFLGSFEKRGPTSRESKAVEDKLNVAAQTLRKDPEFLKAVARRDTKLTATLLSKTANVDAKVSVRFKDKVDVENLTIFICCQQTAQGLACGIWIY